MDERYRNRHEAGRGGPRGREEQPGQGRWRDDDRWSAREGDDQTWRLSRGSEDRDRDRWQREDWRDEHGAPQRPPHGGVGYGGERGFEPQWRDFGSTQRRTMPKSYQRSDDRIREDIYEQIIARNHIDASDVTVEVKDGNVTLSGEVPARRVKHEIEDIADACAGVKDVDNRLRVKRGLMGSLFGSDEERSDRDSERARAETSPGAGATTTGRGRQQERH